MPELLLGVLSLVVVAGGLLVPHLLLRDLRPVPSGAARRKDLATAVTVSVVVPARDEEATLPALLASLRDLTVDVVEVVVVDDDSRDDTGAVARAGGARVLVPGVPPRGWTGKAWACHVGAGATRGERLLFLDADTVLAPDALAGLLELHHRHGGLVSVQPFHGVRRAYEQLSAYFNAVSVLASGAFGARPARRPTAFGPCLLTSRDDYERAGGHAAARAAILDDVALAAAYQRAGLPVRCFVGGQAVRMRSYPGGLRQLVSGWTKNFASGAAATDPRARFGAVLWLCAHHVVAFGLLLSPLAQGRPAWWAVAWLVVAWQLRALLRRLGSFRWWSWVLFPVPLLAFDLIFVRSAVRTVVRRSVRWRGRHVDLRRRNASEDVV